MKYKLQICKKPKEVIKEKSEDVASSKTESKPLHAVKDSVKVEGAVFFLECSNQ